MPTGKTGCICRRERGICRIACVGIKLKPDDSELVALGPAFPCGRKTGLAAARLDERPRACAIGGKQRGLLTRAAVDADIADRFIGPCVAFFEEKPVGIAVAHERFAPPDRFAGRDSCWIDGRRGGRTGGIVARRARNVDYFRIATWRNVRPAVDAGLLAYRELDDALTSTPFDYLGI